MAVPIMAAVGVKGLSKARTVVGTITARYVCRQQSASVSVYGSL